MKKKILTRGMLPYSTSKYSSRYLIPPTFENSLQNLLLELLQLPHHCIFNLAQVLKTTMILIWEKKNKKKKHKNCWHQTYSRSDQPGICFSARKTCARHEDYMDGITHFEYNCHTLHKLIQGRITTNLIAL